MKKLVFLVFLAGSCIGLRAQDIREQFANPPKQYRPMVRWWWPGGDVTDEELRREIGQMDEAWFTGAEIQPFNRQLDPKMPDEARRRVNDYLTPNFYSHVVAAIDEAKKRGMWIDFTFGSGWPFGGVGVVTPELSSVELRSTQRSVTGPHRMHENLVLPEPLVTGSTEVVGITPEWKARLQQRQKLIAIVAVRGSAAKIAGQDIVTVKQPGKLDAGTAVVLTDKLQEDGTLDWDVPAGEWQIFAFKEIPTQQRAKWVVSTPPNLVLDHLSKHAFEVYADRIGGTLQQNLGDTFSNGLRAMFCDSLEVAGYLFWSDDFLAEFQRRRGYDLTPYLPLLKSEGKEEGAQASPESRAEYEMGEFGTKAREDYWKTISELMMENFYLPYDLWAKEHHLLARVQAHGSPTDLLTNYGAADIPETETLYEKGRDDFLKLAVSAGDLYGHRIITSEAFAFPRQAYQVYPEMLKRLADRQLVDGVNQIIYHGFPYVYMDRPEPGWFPFSAGPSFSTALNPHNPFWPFVKPLNEYITRVQYLSQAGTSIVPVALYRGAALYDAVPSESDNPEIDTVLNHAGYAFDDINADALLRSKVVEHRLVAASGFAYSALVLQLAPTVPATVAAKLREFAAEGLPIVDVGAPPKVEVSMAELEQGKPNVETFAGKSIAALQELPAALRGVAPNLRFHGAPLPFLEKRLGGLDIFFITNPSAEEQTLDASFAAEGLPELWDPWTGKTSALWSSKDADGTRVKAAIEGYGSALVVFGGTKVFKAGGGSSYATDTTELGKKGWAFHAEGIGPASKPFVADMQFVKLEDWSNDPKLKNFSGRGTYTTTFALPAEIPKQSTYTLKLGEVANAAEVVVNGKPVAKLLMHPFTADITSAVHAGENTLQITVMNPLYNALSANGASLNYGVEETHTANGLLPGGLLGPVTLEVR